MKMLPFLSKSGLAAIILAITFSIAGCQSKGGELLPIAGEDVEIKTTRFENDTALINGEKLKLKLYGTWTESSYIHLRVSISNESNQPLRLTVKDFTLKNDKNQIWSISTVNEKPDLKVIYSNGKDKELPVVEIKANEKKSLVLEFAPLINFTNAVEADKTLKFTLPIEINGAKKEYKLNFKVIPQKDASGKSDPNDW